MGFILFQDTKADDIFLFLLFVWKGFLFLFYSFWPDGRTYLPTYLTYLGVSFFLSLVE